MLHSHVGSAGGGSLTSWRRQNHVRILGRSSNLGDPSAVTLQGPPQCHLLGHFYQVWQCLLPGWVRIFQRYWKSYVLIASRHRGKGSATPDAKAKRGEQPPQGIMGNVDFIILTVSTNLHVRWLWMRRCRYQVAPAVTNTNEHCMFCFFLFFLRF